MKTLLFYLFALLPFAALGQGMILRSGDRFPAIPIQQIINAPMKSIELSTQPDKKFYILNFWGTWCAPCIPEMDVLSELQQNNTGKIQVLAMSDDAPEKLHRYLQGKSTKIWLATDTSFLLYHLFNFASVSHSAIIGPDRKIVALMKTHSITQGLLDSLYNGEKIRSDANLKEKPINTASDLFAVDSTLASNFTLRSYMIGQQSMMQVFSGKSRYAKRRISFINSGITSLYKTAYKIVSNKQIIYEVDEKKINNYDNRNSLYNVDILVKPEEKDSLYVILQQKLNALLPVRARIEYRTVPVYVITANGFSLPISTQKSSYGFSGRGYEGTAVTIAEFANDYLNNELSLPVVDESSLKGRFDIRTAIEARTHQNVISSVEKLGLKIEQQQRKIRMLILYAPNE